MKENSAENHLVISEKQRVITEIDNNEDESQREEGLLGINMDSTLTFENHINKISERASQKLNALSRIS